MAAFPVYLIARDRFSKPWMGLLFAVVYLMYAPIQWISWANYHPEALVIAPLLYAWWFATQRRWRGMFIALLIALSIREDTALVVIMLGIILLIMYRPGKGEHRDRMMALATIGLGFVWYAIATRFVIPHFNQGKQPFYIQYFYSNYGKDVPAIIETMLRHPNRVIGDATQPDRLRFYRDLALPLGGLPLAAPLALLMALPQMLASVIGLSPYARSIHYQYTAMMIAPLMIAAIEGAWVLWRFKIMHVILPHLVAGLRIRHQRRVVAVADRRFVQRVGPTPATPRVDARGAEAGARHRLGSGDVHVAAAPVAPRRRSTTGRTRGCRRTGATTTATGCRTRRPFNTSSSTCSRSARRRSPWSPVSSRPTAPTRSCSTKTTCWSPSANQAGSANVRNLSKSLDQLPADWRLRCSSGCRTGAEFHQPSAL